jgi:hypothetical protein
VLAALAGDERLADSDRADGHADAPAVKSLRANVPKSCALTLSSKRVAPGRYRITVTDRSATRNFHLVGPGVNRRTGRAFLGTATWTVTLSRGTYRFGNDPARPGRLVVA